LSKSIFAKANNAISTAQTSLQKRKANQSKYESSCYLQLLDNEPAPPETHLDEIKQERLSRANAQKEKFLNDLGAKLNYVILC